MQRLAIDEWRTQHKNTTAPYYHLPNVVVVVVVSLRSIIPIWFPTILHHNTNRRRCEQFACEACVRCVCVCIHALRATLMVGVGAWAYAKHAYNWKCWGQCFFSFFSPSLCILRALRFVYERDSLIHCTTERSKHAHRWLRVCTRGQQVTEACRHTHACSILLFMWWGRWWWSIVYGWFCGGGGDSGVGGWMFFVFVWSMFRWRW